MTGAAGFGGPVSASEAPTWLETNHVSDADPLEAIGVDLEEG